MPIIDSTNNKRRLQRTLKSQTHNPHSHHRSIIGQWNVMADAFSSPSHYTRVPASGEATDWPLRRERIMGEILRWAPDVVTLQVRRGAAVVVGGLDALCKNGWSQRHIFF